MASTGHQEPSSPANLEPGGSPTPAPPPPTHTILLPVEKAEYWQSPSPFGANSWDEVEIHTAVEPQHLHDLPSPNEHQWQRLTDTRSDRRFTISAHEPDSVVRCDRKITLVRHNANRLSLRVDVGVILATRSEGQQDWYETKHHVQEWSTEVAIPLPPQDQEGQTAAKADKKKGRKTGKVAKHSKEKQKGETRAPPRARTSVNRACPFLEDSDTL
ncbi:uncharacterized protein MYCFIDRAFT_212721 [Pseudocercospora fijiensis CIRAD86]|uniref:Uncharacterized protein n=1 Tax=Pseudocercospora fijiensis (strain CIRAD86) TaxID=383855 RepID=M2YGX7_PSEFD|nr:uncharacterized protein MYCFIDRAFT_212721 [Pseudocercospora fijiensis CIRAD86]EME77070.1 hypothetical protein MYCFIDRAFT_212721 [Pseudocercospora fijiensis CIRAD86]